jgi:rhodanese-related sulfurtransferase
MLHGDIDVKIDAAPLGQLIRKARHGDIDVLKKKKIITYCSSGYRGNIAADELNKLGFDTGFHHYSYPVISSPSTTATTTLHMQDLLYCLE